VFQALTVGGSIVGSSGGKTGSKWVGPTGDAAADATEPSLGSFITTRVKLKPPTLGTNADVTPVSGYTLIRIPGTHKFVKLVAGEQIPNGSEIDARHGSIQITLALPNGKSETGVFYDGRFFLNQNKKNGDASATLSGGSFAICKSHKKGHSDGHVASIAKAKAKSSNGKSKKKVRSLWANAHGNFTTKGAGGSAAVLGTKWYTEDRCDGTYFKVARDKIKVTVYYPHRHTVIVKQGHSFLAPPKP
jgi:predicted RecA/RadA family phage recombinase